MLTAASTLPPWKQAVSRGFGDFEFKTSKGVTQEELMVTPAPDITVRLRHFSSTTLALH